MMSKIISAQQAVELIQDGDIFAVDGFKCSAIPEEIFIRLRERYDATGSPKNLTFFSAPSMGAEGRGTDRLGTEGLIRKFICSHAAISPSIGALAAENKLSCYMIPMGNCVRMLQAAAGGEPGFITHVGLGTFADPLFEASRANQAADEELVRRMEIDGKPYLYYPAIHPNICFIKASLADPNGNTSFEKEAMYLSQFELAAATHNSGGIVVVVADKLAESDSLDPRNVKIHGFMVDYVVETAPEYAGQSYATGNIHHGEYCGDFKLPVSALPPIPLDIRKVCGRRGALELPGHPGALINLGVGVPEAVSAVAAEEGISERLTFSIEAGTIGGIPQGGEALGISVNPTAIYRMWDMLQVYSGGAIDAAFLGAAEIDRDGNVNVSKFNGRIIGPGGFIDIAQNAKKICFMGTFTAVGLKEHVEDGRLVIDTEGSKNKFKRNVEQITFSGKYAFKSGQTVLYITERAVFKLTDRGLTLIEIAPGIDLKQDILAHMDFTPIISDELSEMDPRIFRNEKMGLSLSSDGGDMA